MQTRYQMLKYLLKVLTIFFIHFALSINAFSASVNTSSHSNEYPNRPIRLIVPFPPGGGADFMGRLIAALLHDQYNFQIVIDNRGGANGIIGGSIASKSTPDGYTLILANNTTHVMAVVLNKNPPYDPIDDFTAISMVTQAPQVLISSNKTTIRNLNDLISQSKAKPNLLSYASGGSASQTHISAEILRISADIDIRHIPYKGTGPGFTALMSGEAQVMFVSLPAAIPHIKSNRVNALAITGKKRSLLLTESPTLDESGLKGFEISPWFGILGPAKLPPILVKKLNTDLVSILHNTETQQKLLSQGAISIGSTPSEFKAIILQEIIQLRKIADHIGLRF